MKKILYSLALAATFSLAACTGGGDKASLAPAEFNQALQSDQAVLLDVRSPEEFAQGHLPGARQLNCEAPDFEQQVRASVPADAHVYLYCRSGRRSADAKARMEQWGYTHVTHLDGGITAWQAQNLPVEH
jgi:rhodanese-related sulfurtransferase